MRWAAVPAVALAITGCRGRGESEEVAAARRAQAAAAAASAEEREAAEALAAKLRLAPPDIAPLMAVAVERFKSPKKDLINIECSAEKLMLGWCEGTSSVDGITRVAWKKSAPTIVEVEGEEARRGERELLCSDIQGATTFRRWRDGNFAICSLCRIRGGALDGAYVYARNQLAAPGRANVRVMTGSFLADASAYARDMRSIYETQGETLPVPVR